MYSYGTGQPVYLSHPSVSSSVSTGAHFRSQDVTLILRQQPKEALVTTEGKEKARKPVDPPPIIQLTVKPQADPAQHFLQSPYLFMCTSLYKVERDEAWDGNASKSLAGSLVSSLHRLKDVDNKDGGFFVFGDISVKVQGNFRLHFSLFDLHKDTSEVQYLGSITSEPFRVLLPKDFKGMDESTYLSRAFSDQGVRLRLRKEPRAMMGNKRPYPYGVDTPVSSTPIRPNMNEYPYEDTTSPNKRFRPDSEDVKRESYPEPSGVSGSGFTSNYASSQYPVRQPSISGPYSMGAQYSSFGGMTTGSTSPYQFRPSISSAASNYFADNLLQTSGAALSSSSMTSQQRYGIPPAQSYAELYSSFGQPRPANSSALSFSDDTAGMGGYRTTANLGLGDEHRPVTAAGIPNSMPMTQQTPQSQSSSHQTHDSINSSRGASFSHSPELIRSGGFQDPRNQLPNPHRPAGRLDDHSHLTTGLTSVYSNQRNPLQAPPTESSLTSHTDTGPPHPSLPYNPDLSQATEGPVVDNSS